MSRPYGEHGRRSLSIHRRHWIQQGRSRGLWRGGSHRCDGDVLSNAAAAPASSPPPNRNGCGGACGTHPPASCVAAGATSSASSTTGLPPEISSTRDHNTGTVHDDTTLTARVPAPTSLPASALPMTHRPPTAPRPALGPADHTETINPTAPPEFS